MRQRSAHRPIFDVEIQRGQITVGNTPGGLPVTVTINQGSGQADPTGDSSIVFDVVFSEAVTGFATGDVTLSGTAGATTAVVAGSGTTYTVTVTGMTGDGTVIATIAAAVATSTASGIPNDASTSTDNTVTWQTGLSVIGTVTDTLLDRVEYVVVSGNYCYLTSRSNDRHIVVDATTKSAPSVAGSRTGTSLNGALSLAKVGNTMFIVANLNGSLTSDNVTTTTPSFIDQEFGAVGVTLIENPEDLAIVGNYAFVICRRASADDSIVAVDISNPASMSAVGGLQSANFNGAANIVAEGNYAYVASDSVADTFSVVDISNPASMSIVGSVTNATAFGSGSQELIKDGDVVYMSRIGGLVTIDVSTPTAPAVLDFISVPLGSEGICKKGTRVYVCGSANDAITTLDVSDPSNLSILDSFTDSTNLDGVVDIVTDGTYIYAACFNGDRLTILQGS